MCSLPPMMQPAFHVDVSAVLPLSAAQAARSLKGILPIISNNVAFEKMRVAIAPMLLAATTNAGTSAEVPDTIDDLPLICVSHALKDCI